MVGNFSGWVKAIPEVDKKCTWQQWQTQSGEQPSQP